MIQHDENQTHSGNGSIAIVVAVILIAVITAIGIAFSHPPP